MATFHRPSLQIPHYIHVYTATYVGIWLYETAIYVVIPVYLNFVSKQFHPPISALFLFFLFMHLFQIASKLCSAIHKLAVGESSQHMHRQMAFNSQYTLPYQSSLQKVQKTSHSYTQNKDYRRLGQSIQAVLNKCL